MTKADYTVEAAWATHQTGGFVIGTSTIGGSDTIFGEWGGNIFSDITADVKRVQERRGRSTDLAYMEQGHCTFYLKDTDGTYNPENAASPLAGLLDVMKPVRATAIYEGNEYGLFYGYVASIEHNPDKYVQESIITAVDFTEWLARSRRSIVIAEQTDKRVDELIGLILDYLGWTDATMRSFDVSATTIASWSADGTSSPLELIEALLAIDRGVFFVDGRGRVCYRNRDIHYDTGQPVDTFTSDHMPRLRAGITKADIINSQTVTATGGTAQTATDEASRTLYGYRDGAGITSPYLASDGDALALAEFLVRLQKSPRIPAREVSLINGDETRLLKQLSREIGDLVTIDESEGGTYFSGRVQAVEHDLSEAFTVHRTRFIIQKTPLVPFRIGVSALGGPHVVVY